MSGHRPDTGPSAAFDGCVRDALAHLYDPAYRPPDLLQQIMGCDSPPGPEAVQAALIRAIEKLKPAPTVPPTARSRRIYDILTYRYVANLTQEETAERVGITARHLRREQSEAAHVLALRLWEQREVVAGLSERLSEEEKLSPAEVPSSAQLPDWLSQVREELLSLRKSAPGAVADVGGAMHRAVELGSTLTSSHGISLQVGRVRSHLVAAIHPAALQQILIAAIRQLTQHTSSGQITLHAERGEGEVRITTTGRPAITDVLPDGSLMREILAAHSGSLEIRAEGDSISFWVRLPSVDRAVLVVDDNVDMVHLYRRYVVGTRYRIVHTAQGRNLLETVEASAPDIIILDVMLPDVDGWELLATLHEYLATRCIPVVVCSVVREEDLALALGAALYLPKPVQREEFIGALDRVLTQASASAPTPPANNETAC